MKKFVVGAVIFLLSGVITVSAKSNKKIDTRVEKAFQKDFINATNAEWSSDDSYYYVQFELNGEKVNAVYLKEEAEFVGYASFIDASHLPTILKEGLIKKFGKHQLANRVIELGYNDSIAYMLTIENDQEILKIRIEGNNSTVLSRLQKL